MYVTYWFSPENWDSRFMNNMVNVVKFSTRWWELLEEVARVAGDYGMNTYIMPFWDYMISNLSGSTWSFDFSNFDRAVELFISKGGLKRIEGGWFFRQHTVPSEEQLVLRNEMASYLSLPEGLKLSDTRVQNYFTQFLPALYSHLQTKGWTGIYVQHIATEPHDAGSMVNDYKQIAQLVRQHMPGIPIVGETVANGLAGVIDIPYLTLETYFHPSGFLNAYRTWHNNGGEVWMYSCENPTKNWANQLLEHPLIQARFQHWLHYRYNFTGFERWGLNRWQNTPDPFDFSTCRDSAGDQWLAYPAYGKMYASIRMAALRDGVADYELLKLLEKKSSSQASLLVNKVIKNHDSYDNSIGNFRETRRQLLEALE